MILTLFEKILIGHLVGDYMLQNNWMAQRKQAGFFPCFVHCSIYTIAVCTLTSFSLQWIATVFLSHFIVDRYSLADKWLKLIKGRSCTMYYEHGHKDVPLPDPIENYIRLRAGFTTLVYAVTDNTMHLIVMLLGAWLLGVGA